MATTDQQRITLTWAKAIPVIIGILIASNTVTGILYVIEKNTENIGYNYDRGNRKYESILEQTEQLIYISELETEIERLKRHQSE